MTFELIEKLSQFKEEEKKTLTKYVRYTLIVLHNIYKYIRWKQRNIKVLRAHSLQNHKFNRKSRNAIKTKTGKLKNKQPSKIQKKLIFSRCFDAAICEIDRKKKPNTYQATLWPGSTHSKFSTKKIWNYQQKTNCPNRQTLETAISIHSNELRVKKKPKKITNWNTTHWNRWTTNKICKNQKLVQTSNKRKRSFIEQIEIIGLFVSSQNVTQIVRDFPNKYFFFVMATFV